MMSVWLSSSRFIVFTALAMIGVGCAGGGAYDGSTHTRAARSLGQGYCPPRFIAPKLSEVRGWTVEELRRVNGPWESMVEHRGERGYVWGDFVYIVPVEGKRVTFLVDLDGRDITDREIRHEINTYIEERESMNADTVRVMYEMAEWHLFETPDRDALRDASLQCWSEATKLPQVMSFQELRIHAMFFATKSNSIRARQGASEPEKVSATTEPRRYSFSSLEFWLLVAKVLL